MSEAGRRHMKLFLVRVIAVGLAGIVYFMIAPGHLTYIVGGYLLLRLWTWHPQEKAFMDGMLFEWRVKKK